MRLLLRKDKIVARYKYVGGVAVPDNPTVDPTTNAGATAVTNWLFSPAQPLLASFDVTQNIRVKIGGFELHPGIEKRHETVTQEGSNAHIKIVWPD